MLTFNSFALVRRYLAIPIGIRPTVPSASIWENWGKLRFFPQPVHEHAHVFLLCPADANATAINISEAVF
jgi:hypothetical protein